MYRKEQRRVQDMEDQQQVITRVSNYPVVKDAWSKMSEVYQRGKDGSRVLWFCGGMAETSAVIAYRMSQPVIGKLPVDKVNDYAVTKLGCLEEKYPVLVKPTEEVVDAVKGYSSSKLDDAKSYSTDKINYLAGATGVRYVLGIAESAVERFLPDVPQEEEEEEEDDSSSQAELTMAPPPHDVVNRAMVLGGKVKRRAYHHAMSKVGALQRRSEESVAKLVHTVNLIDFAKRNLSESEYYGEVKEKIMSVYSEIVSEEEVEPLPPSATWDRKAIVSARILTSHIRTALDAMSKLAYALPPQTRKSLADAYNSAETMFQTLINFDLLMTHGNDFLSQLKSNLDNLKTHVFCVGTHLVGTAQSILLSSPLGGLIYPGCQRGVSGLEVPTRFSETIDDEDTDSADDTASQTAADSEAAANSEPAANSDDEDVDSGEEDADM